MARQTPDSVNSAEFASFMRAYQDMVFTTAARIAGNDKQAEDIAQEVFLKAYENYEQIRNSPRVGGWLKTVATNLSLNYLARYRRRWQLFSEMRRQDDDDDQEIELPVPENVASGVDLGMQRQLIEQALQRLPEGHRVPLVLYHFEDMSYEEIARRLGVSLAKVKTDIFRARTALAKLLTRKGLGADIALSP
ncbi:MAG TPA: sigma-70 family RNA polymerase sigma factor [Steroidobacter sp.]